MSLDPTPRYVIESRHPSEGWDWGELSVERLELTSGPELRGRAEISLSARNPFPFVGDLVRVRLAYAGEEYERFSGVVVSADHDRRTYELTVICLEDVR